MSAALLAALSAAATPDARAQEEQQLLDLPHRARAILPAGLVQLESMYAGHPTLTTASRPAGPPDIELHRLFTYLDARVPIEHLLLAASVIEGWQLLRVDSVEWLLHLFASPQLGAAYRDAIGSWRYEVGGATTIPVARDDVVAAREPPIPPTMPLFPSVPLRNLLGAGPLKGPHEVRFALVSRRGAEAQRGIRGTGWRGA